MNEEWWETLKGPARLEGHTAWIAWRALKAATKRGVQFPAGALEAWAAAEARMLRARMFRGWGLPYESLEKTQDAANRAFLALGLQGAIANEVRRDATGEDVPETEAIRAEIGRRDRATASTPEARHEADVARVLRVLEDGRVRAALREAMKPPASWAEVYSNVGRGATGDAPS